MTAADDRLTIGEVAQRTGVATSALRFYEAEGLIAAERSEGGHRRFRRDVLRRIAFVRAAQTVGLELGQIRAALESLPQARTPTAQDWQRLSAAWRPVLDDRIARLQDLRDRLGACIGCGCLSLRSCAFCNADDRAGALGPGPRYLLGDAPSA